MNLERNPRVLPKTGTWLAQLEMPGSGIITVITSIVPH